VTGRERRARDRRAPSLPAALISGALMAALAMVVAGWLLAAGGRVVGRPALAAPYRALLAAGAWVWFPLWGAALGALRAALGAERLKARLGCLALALILALLPLAWRPEVAPEAGDRWPTTPAAKRRAILRWSYRSTGTVLHIVTLSRDPDPDVREPAVLALGINRVVTGIERDTSRVPAGDARSPVRDSLRARLLECLGDPVEIIRAEAARALWKAPRTFGTERAAAETLAAMLARAASGRGPERLAWLALDAAAGAPDSSLKHAAARFAARTTDPALRDAAGAAARWP